MNHRKTRLYFLAVCCLLYAGTIVNISVHAASQETTTKGGPMAAENVQGGAKLFASNCAFCHGSTAKGTSTGVSLIDSSLVRHDKDGDLIGKVLRDGRVEKGMPAFPNLNAEQISNVASFLHARITVMDSVETAGPQGGYQLKRLLTGDATSGKHYFDSKCQRCHSTTGDLAGVAQKYRPAELEARFLYPRANAAKGTIVAGSGKVTKGKLQHQDSFYVAIIDDEGNYRSWNAGDVKVSVEDPMQEHRALLDQYTDKDIHDVFAYLETLK